MTNIEKKNKAEIEYAPIKSCETLDLSGQLYETGDVNWPSRHGFITGFKAGAKWMAKQGESHDSIVWQDEDGDLFVQVFINDSQFKMVDKIIVQVRKK